MGESNERSWVMGEDTSGGLFARAGWKHGSDDQRSRLEADCDEKKRAQVDLR